MGRHNHHTPTDRRGSSTLRGDPSSCTSSGQQLTPGLTRWSWYEAAQIVDRFDDAYERTSITDVHQRERLGLWHSVVQARPHVDGTFLLVNGDNVFAGSVVPAVTAVGEADAVLGVEEVSPEVATMTGVIEPDERGRVMEIVEKPAEPPATLFMTGCYVLVFNACALL